MNIDAATILTQSRAGRFLRYMQIMTGVKSSVTMIGVIRMRATLLVDVLGNTRTFGSLEMLLTWF